MALYYSLLVRPLVVLNCFHCKYNQNVYYRATKRVYANIYLTKTFRFKFQGLKKWNVSFNQTSNIIGYFLLFVSNLTEKTDLKLLSR